MRNLIIVTFIIISTAMGQEKSSMDVTTKNPDNDTYNLDQKMSINMEDSDIKNVLSNPGDIISKGYDIVINGYEVAGGSIRIHDHKLQKDIFKIMNLSEQEISEKFGFFIDALKYGTPPHGGIAFGWLSSELLKKDPPTIGWFSNENPFDMDATKLNLSKTAAKYTQSTISYISAVGLQTAIQQLLNIKVLNILKHSDKLAKMLFSNLEGSDWKFFRKTTSKEFSSHIISLMPPSADRLKSTFEHLSKKGLICGIRNERLRISIAHYNDSNDIKYLGASLLHDLS